MCDWCDWCARPNEHDLAVLAFGVVLAVVRTDAGDGLPGQSFTQIQYYTTL